MVVLSPRGNSSKNTVKSVMPAATRTATMTLAKTSAKELIASRTLIIVTFGNCWPSVREASAFAVLAVDFG